MTDPILPIEEQVPTLGTCRQLYVAGFPRGTRFVWDTEKNEIKSRWVALIGKRSSETENEFWKRRLVPAPTFAELWTVLPRKIRQKDGDLHLWMQGDVVGYESEDRAFLVTISADVVDALARVYLKLGEWDLLPASAYAETQR